MGDCAADVLVGVYWGRCYKHTTIHCMLCTRRPCTRIVGQVHHQRAQGAKVGAWATQAEQALPEEVASSVAEVRAELVRYPLEGEAVVRADHAGCACPRRQEGRGGLRRLLTVQRACRVQHDGCCCQGRWHSGDLDTRVE